MKFKPIADKVVIEALRPSEISAGGIIIPNMAKKRQNVGIVRAVANHDTLEVGMKVMFSENAGTYHEEDGKVYRIVKESDVWLITHNQ